MEARLKRLNQELESALHDLKGQHATELLSLQELVQDSALIPHPSPNAAKTVELLNALQTELTPPLHTLVDSMFGFIASKALASVVSYKIPDLLSQHGQQSALQLAQCTTPKLDPSNLAQLLRLLANTGIFKYDPSTDTYANNASSELIRSDHWTQWHLWASLYPTVFYDIFSNLESALKADEQRSATHITYGAEASAPLFAILSKLPWAHRFAETIGAGSTAMAPGLLADYAWADVASVGTVCDLGGGNGEFLFTLLSAHSKMRGAVLELDGSSALAAARDNFAEGGKFAVARDRVDEIHAGNFLESVPAYPVYTIRWTIHNWGDEDTVKILKNARKAIDGVAGEGKRLLIIEAVVTGDRLARPALFGSVIMMSGSKKGKERTEKEWNDLCSQAGWRIEKIVQPRGCIPSIIDLRIVP